MIHLPRRAQASTSTTRRGRSQSLRPLAVTTALGLAVASVGLTAAPALAADDSPDFGPNVTIFTPDMSVDAINAALEAASHETEFSTNRHAFFFAPGTYGSAAGEDDPSTATGIINAQVGYYEQVAGLGASPDDVVINGAIHAEGVAPQMGCPFDGAGDSALNTFWRSMSNLAINPIQRPIPSDTGIPGACYPPALFPEGVADAHQLRWAVSQASPLRRVHVEGSLTVFPRFGGYSSGGYLADSQIDGNVVTGSQQQWYGQNSTVDNWGAGVWNTVLSGVEGGGSTTFPTPPNTVVASTDESRPAPYLTLDGDGNYSVVAPAVRTDASGAEWSAPGDRSIPISDFYIAHEGDSADTIDAALADGKDLLLTPGVYSLDHALHVSDPNTVVLGLGLATLSPTTGSAALEVDDVSGVQISGITIDAGAVESPTLLQVGEPGSAASHALNPTTLTDVFVRVGGPHAGSTETAIEVNSSDVLLDDIWAWRADHGTGVGWDVNTADHGLVVNGDRVHALGLFVEHFEKNQVIWNGEDGETTFYQSEMPYDVPSQAAWMDGDRQGYASYRVADDVVRHHAVGLGVYSFFNQGQAIVADSGIQAPQSRRVTFQSASTVKLDGMGSITHVINDAGATADTNGTARPVVSYPAADTTAPIATVGASKDEPDGANGWYRGVSITPSATDDFAPAPTTRVRLDGGAWTVADGSETVLADGHHTVQVRATDDSGNDSALVTWTGDVDATAPVTSATVTGAGTSSASIALSAVDPTSGVALLEYRIGAGAWTAYTTPIAAPVNTTTVSYRATDVAGNTSELRGVSATGATFVPATPTISGTAVVGHTLTARTGSWGTARVTFTYRWTRGGVAIPGATHGNYRLTSADAGHTVRVVVTGTTTGAASAAKTSAALVIKRAR